MLWSAPVDVVRGITRGCSVLCCRMPVECRGPIRGEDSGLSSRVRLLRRQAECQPRRLERPRPRGPMWLRTSSTDTPRISAISSGEYPLSQHTSIVILGTSPHPACIVFLGDGRRVSLSMLILDSSFPCARLPQSLIPDSLGCGFSESQLFSAPTAQPSLQQIGCIGDLAGAERPRNRHVHTAAHHKGDNQLDQRTAKR